MYYKIMLNSFLFCLNFGQIQLLACFQMTGEKSVDTALYTELPGLHRKVKSKDGHGKEGVLSKE